MKLFTFAKVIFFTIMSFLMVDNVFAFRIDNNSKDSATFSEVDCTGAGYLHGFNNTIAAGDWSACSWSDKDCNRPIGNCAGGKQDSPVYFIVTSSLGVCRIWGAPAGAEINFKGFAFPYCNASW